MPDVVQEPFSVVEKIFNFFDGQVEMGSILAFIHKNGGNIRAAVAAIKEALEGNKALADPVDIFKFQVVKANPDQLEMYYAKS